MPSYDDIPVRRETNAIPAALHATVRHVELIQRKIVQLEKAREEAERQLCWALLREIETDDTNSDALLDAFSELRERLPFGISQRWNEIMPFTASTASNRLKYRGMFEPNGPGRRSWVGERPVDKTQRIPRKGVAVVYVLYSVDLRPVYVGSTGNFRTRIGAHERTRNDWHYYMAAPCTDREAAYQLEEHLLRTRMPPGNKRSSR